jgi:hypothetical protein
MDDRKSTAPGSHSPALKPVPAASPPPERDGDGLDAPVGRTLLLRGGIASGVVAVVAGFGLPHLTDVEVALVNGYFYFMWVLAIVLTAVVMYFWRAELPLPKPARNALLAAAGAGLIGGALIVLATEWEFRILADEANLLGLSMALNLDRTYRNIIEGNYYYDAFHPSVYSLDPRPALHPFLVSLLHDALGYSANHSFAVNIIAAALTVAFVFHIGRRLAGLAGGVFAAALLVANPIFALGATSSGFEPLNLLFVTVTMWSVYCFLKDASPRRLALMVLCGVATVHCRYESVVVLLAIALAVLFRWKELRFDRASWLLLCAPLLLVPYAWQRAISALYHEIDSSKPVFSPRYMPDNLEQFARFAFDRGGADFPMNHWIASLAVGGMVLLASLCWKRPRGDVDREGATLTLIGIGGVFLVHMACWVVDYRTVAVQRYAISYASAFALLAAWPLIRLAATPLGRIVAWGVLAFVLSHGLAKAGHNTQGRWLTLYREYKLNLDFLKKWPQEGTLFICDRPGMYAVHEYGAMSFENANKNPSGLIDGIRRKLTPNVFVEQKIYYNKPFKPSPELAASFSTETVYEYQNDAQYFVRISRIVPPPPPPSVAGKRR